MDTPTNLLAVASMVTFVVALALYLKKHVRAEWKLGWLSFSLEAGDGQLSNNTASAATTSTSSKQAQLPSGQADSLPSSETRKLDAG